MIGKMVKFTLFKDIGVLNTENDKSESSIPERRVIMNVTDLHSNMVII